MNIGRYAFNYCCGLESVVCGNNIKSVGERAFYGCTNLTSLDIPESVESLGIQVIEYCPAMKDLYVHHTKPLVIDEYTFNETTQRQLTLHVPSGCKDAYKSAPYWKGFSKIVDDITSVISPISTETKNAMFFDMKGNRIDNLHHGINIIRHSNGTTRKVIVK